ncbi:MAG TPA: hypothetical protein VKF81_13190 [Blastocatellia bacterium]|nr:hypothetical protein [Blastocatellia bacterium]
MYVVTLGFSGGAAFANAVLLYRSIDGGLTFGSGVALPKPAGVTYVDKPVMDVHKNDPNILAVTVNPLDSSGHVAGSAYVVICTSASTLSNFTVVQPLDGSGIPVKPWLSLHPLIDPISPGSGSYWLFLVYTNDDFSGSSRTQAGVTVFQYSVTGSSLGNGGRPINTLGHALPGALWTINPSFPSGSAIEKCLRVYRPTAPGNIGSNVTKAAIDYCDPNAHRMYLPNHVNANGISSDLYVTVWQYSTINQALTSIVTGEQEIYNNEKQKYAACAVTDGHGRVWVNTYVVSHPPNNNNDDQRAQTAAIAIDRITAATGPIAYGGVRMPYNLSDAYDDVLGTGLFLGDYVYTQATFYSFNGRSRIASPTFMDFSFWCGRWEYDIGVSGWF